MSIDLLADEHLDQVLRFFLVRRGAAGRWADAEVVATGANNPAACRLWAAPLQYCCSSTKYLLQLERPHSRHWIGNWDNQLHLLLCVRCVACGLETTQRPLSRCTFTPEDLDEQFDGAIGYLVEPADSPIVSRPGLGLQPPVNQARHRPHVRGSRGLSGAVRACRGLSGPVGPCGRPATRVGEARYAGLSRRGHVANPNPLFGKPGWA